MSHELEAIGARIKRARKKKKLSQADLAALLNLSSAHVSQIERGKTNCSITILRRIAEVLGVSSDWLLMVNISCASVEVQQEISELLDGCSPVEIDVIIGTVKHLKGKLALLRCDENNM